MVTETDYQDARENPLLRADFVKAVDLEDMAEFVSDVTYNPSRGDSQASTKASRLHWFFPMKGRKSPIGIYPPLFEFPRVDDFLSTLVDHEGFHAKDIFYNVEAYPSAWSLFRVAYGLRKNPENRALILDYDLHEVLSSSMEVRASLNQLQQAATGRRSLSVEMLDDI